MRKESEVYKTGQVLLVKFHPSHGADIKKYRPAVVISETAEQADSRFVLISPLTTKPSLKKNSLELEIKKLPFLKKKSYLMMWYLRTIDTQRVQYVLGEIPKKTMKTVRKRLQTMFD